LPITNFKVDYWPCLDPFDEYASSNTPPLEGEINESEFCEGKIVGAEADIIQHDTRYRMLDFETNEYDVENDNGVLQILETV